MHMYNMSEACCNIIMWSDSSWSQFANQGVNCTLMVRSLSVRKDNVTKYT